MTSEVRLDALEDIIKARKAKGLSAWKKFERVQEELAGKSVSDITFTTSYPGQEGQAKQLGSLSGNLQFLLGYGSPAFYLAPYHWRLIDMNLSDADIAKKQHPANMKYWKEAGLDLEPEGDLAAGKASPSVSSSTKLRAKVASKKTGTVTVRSGYGSFVIDADANVVHSQESGYMYALEVVKNSYLYYDNLKTFEDLEGVDTQKSFRLAPFDSSVYPVLTKALPFPGSVVRCSPEFSMLVTPTSLHFIDPQVQPLEVRVFDRVYKSFDLRKGGDTHPSILLQFLHEYFADTAAAELPLESINLDKAVTISSEEDSRTVVATDGHYAVLQK